MFPCLINFFTSQVCLLPKTNTLLKTEQMGAFLKMTYFAARAIRKPERTGSKKGIFGKNPKKMRELKLISRLINGDEMNNFQGEIWKEIAGSHFGAERVIWHIVNEMEVNSDNKFDRNSNNTSHSPPWQSHPCSCRKPSWRSRMTWVSWWSSPWSSCHRLQPDGSPCALAWSKCPLMMTLIKMLFDWSW